MTAPIPPTKVSPPRSPRRGSMRVSIVALVLGALVSAAWLSAGLTPWRDAISSARAPSDFTTDFVPAARIASSRRSGLPLAPDLRTGNAEALRLGAQPYMDVGVPFGAHPPPAVLLVAALVPLGFPAAAAAWMLLSLACLAVVAWVASNAGTHPNRHGRSRPPLAHTVLLFVALFVLLASWPPVLHNLEKGQWSVLLAGLLAAAWWAWGRGHDRSVGACIALAGAFKVMPFVVLLAFMGAPAPRRRRVWIGAAASLALTTGSTMFVLGPAPWGDFFRSAPANTSGWQTAPANTLSLWGALARLLVGGPFARALPLGAKGAPLAQALWVIAAVALCLLVFRQTRPRLRAGATPADTSAESEDLSHASEPTARSAAAANASLAGPFSAACVLAVVLNPLSWSHGAVLLVVPSAVIATRLCRKVQGSPAPSSAKATVRVKTLVGPAVFAAAVVLLTLPRQTLLTWAGPLPVASASGLILAAHLGGALILLVLALCLPRFDPRRAD